MYWTFGQVCGTPHPTTPTIYSGSATGRNLGNSEYCIDVFFHIVRNTSGTNAFTPPNTDAIVKELNKFYSPHNIVINNAGTGFINNSNSVSIEDRREAESLGQTNNRSDVINYYIVKNLWSTDRGTIVGTANSIPSNNLVIRSDRVLTSTSPHELGHCLDLLHTHETARGVERLDGSNCHIAGDWVCDTPADPKLGTSNVNANCTYIGGGGYKPLTNNIMSYSRGYCRNKFTKGQGNRMRMALDNVSILSDITSNRCVSMSALNQLVHPNTETVRLSNLPSGVTVKWTASSNVSIISRSNLQASLRSKNTTPGSSNGWVKAVLSNGIELSEPFRVVNPPKTSLITSLISFGSVNLSTGRWTNITARYNGQISPGGFTWQWSVPSSFIRRHSSSDSYIHVRPNVQKNTQIYIRVKVCNVSGCSGWKGAWFNVTVAPPRKRTWGVPLSPKPTEVHY